MKDAKNECQERIPRKKRPSPEPARACMAVGSSRTHQTPRETTTDTRTTAPCLATVSHRKAGLRRRNIYTAVRLQTSGGCRMIARQQPGQGVQRRLQDNCATGRSQADIPKTRPRYMGTRTFLLHFFRAITLPMVEGRVGHSDRNIESLSLKKCSILETKARTILTVSQLSLWCRTTTIAGLAHSVREDFFSGCEHLFIQDIFHYLLPSRGVLSHTLHDFFDHLWMLALDSALHHRYDELSCGAEGLRLTNARSTIVTS